MVLWLWSEHGVQRIEDKDFGVSLFLRPPPWEIADVRRRLEILDQVKEVREVERRVDIGSEEAVPVLEVLPRHYKDLQDIARIVDSNGGYHDYPLYNVDLRFSQRYNLARGIFPFGLLWHSNGRWRAEEEQFALDYPIPRLRIARLTLDVDAPLGIPRFQDKLLGARIDDVAIQGSESEVLERLGAAVKELDPDVLATENGDAFAMPYLARKSAEAKVPLQLGREPDRFVEKRGKSYFTYGKIVYKPGQYILKGRLHLDAGHFAFRESGLAGLAELSRLSLLTPQEQSRLTPGTAISAMQVNLATRDGCLVIWKKNRPEDFKTAEELVLGDRGGFIFEPEVGLHEGLYELDYASLYPSIMVKFNVSPECLDCSCCDRTAIPVPGLRYHLCTSRVGLIPRVLKPILERRRYYKKMKREPVPLEEVYRDRDAILKWLLVTCFFGYTGYRNARFGRIECHEAINAFARDLLVRTMEIAESHGYEVVHGIVDSQWLRPREGADPIRAVIDHVAGSTGLTIELEGRYKWIVFLPCKTTGVGALNRYYGLLENGEFKLRGIELRKHDTPPFINAAQEAMLSVLSEAGTAAEFHERIPKAVDVLRFVAKRILDNAVPLREFVLTRSVTKTLDEYVVLTATVAALRQLKDRGFTVEPGESVRYVVTDMKSRDHESKVKVAEFLEGSERVDKWEYIHLLCRSGQTLLAPFGYTEERLLGACRDLSDLSIDHVPGSAIAVAEDYVSHGKGKARGGVGYAKAWRVEDLPEAGATGA